jgi:predicted LPLAT superfamily acyltransferase
MGSHLGSFEAIRACGRSRTRRPVVMAMVEEHARKLNAVLAAVNPNALDGIVGLGRLESMLKLREHLDHGAMVGVLADRTPGNEPVLAVPFLGEAAPFPTGPMRMAAILRCPVFFMTGLYAGANRYDIHFEKIADFSGAEAAPRGARTRLVAEALARYAGRLEHYARLSPFNWFNFYDVWSPPPRR